MLLLALTTALVWSSTGANITLNRDVSGFKGIEISGPFVVDIDMTGRESLRIEAALNDTNVTDALSTTVENGALKVKFLWPYEWDVGAFTNLIHIFITGKSVSSYVLSGSGSMSVNTVLKLSSVSVVSSGSGNVSVPVDSHDLNVVLSGSGFINLRGKTESVNMVVSGAGKVIGNQLEADKASIAIYGAGDVNIDARDTLSVVSMGSGLVRYGADPQLTVMKMGSGDVVRSSDIGPRS